MKKLFALLFVLMPSLAFSQDGFKVIEKAEARFKKGHFKKSLLLLDKAEKMNYGFCGNAWGDAHRAIDLLRFEIYCKQEKYQYARNCLDSIYWVYTDDNIDSMKIRTYQLEIGVDSLKNMFDVSLKNTSIQCDEEYETCYALIPLTDGWNTVKLKVDDFLSIGYIMFEFHNNTKISEEEKVKIWMDVFLKSSAYRIIKEPIKE